MDRIRQNPTELLRLVNIAVGGLMVAGGIGALLNHSFSSIIIGSYELLLGAVTIALEVRAPTEEQKALVHRYASFLHSFVGRGVFYLLLGVLMLNYPKTVWKRRRPFWSYYSILYICGSIVGFVGLAYIGLHFARLVEPPSTMQPPQADEEAQQVWQGPTE